MSASLVGSEMCIRDRPPPPLPAPSRMGHAVSINAVQALLMRPALPTRRTEAGEVVGQLLGPCHPGLHEAPIAKANASLARGAAERA
eukprot:9231705-Alexandrium_andersonii.AAC.1